MGVWESSEHSPLQHSCPASLQLSQDPGLPEPPATCPIQLCPDPNIAFPLRTAHGWRGRADAASPVKRLLASSLSCLLSPREEGESRGGQGGRGRARKREGGRAQQRQKHSLKLPLAAVAQEFPEHKAAAHSKNEMVQIFPFPSTPTSRADKAEGTKVPDSCVSLTVNTCRHACRQMTPRE